MNLIIGLILDLIEFKKTEELIEISKLLKMNPVNLIKGVLTNKNIVRNKLNSLDWNLSLSNQFGRIISKAKIRVRKYVKSKFKEYEEENLYEATAERGEETYDFAVLNSSWIMNGSYANNPETDRGILTLDFKKAKHSYTYFNVPKSVWENMKAAKGAGTVFWRDYLHKGGSWASYNAIELMEADKATNRAKSMALKETKTYYKNLQKYGNKRYAKRGGISQYKAVLQTKKRIYNQKLGIIRSRINKYNKTFRR